MLSSSRTTRRTVPPLIVELRSDMSRRRQRIRRYKAVGRAPGVAFVPTTPVPCYLPIDICALKDI